MIADAVLYGLAPNPGSSVHVVRTLAGILASSCLYHLPIALGQQWHCSYRPIWNGGYSCGYSSGLSPDSLASWTEESHDF